MAASVAWYPQDWIRRLGCEHKDKKRRKKQLAQTKEEKAKRSQSRKEKLTEEDNKDMAAQKQGVTYESALAFKSAQRVAK